jgi:L-amino acid N-acyltransferase YncA
VEVRPARDTDLDRIAAIYAHYVEHSVATFETEAPSVTSWRTWLGDLTERHLPFLVAEADGLVCGYAYAGPWRGRPAYQFSVEDAVYVAPGQGRRGIGSALLGGLLDACTAAGRRQVIAVIADSGDDSSVALHNRFGFVQAGRLTDVGHKHGRWLDTVLMQRTLSLGRYTAYALTPRRRQPAGPCPADRKW